MVNGELWHNRLDHSHVEIVKRVLCAINVDCQAHLLLEFCYVRQMEKSRRLPLKHMNNKFVNAFDTVHVDI